MSDLIIIEHVKNKRAMRHIAFMAFALLTVIAVPIIWRYYDTELPPSLSHLLDVTLSGLFLVVIQFFKTTNHTAPAKLRQHNQKKDVVAKDGRKYDFHMY